MPDPSSAVLDLLSTMLTPEVAQTMVDPAASHLGFAREIGDLALSNVFEKLWTRPGLDPRLRSIVTISLLIGMRASSELAIHVPAAVRNGVSLSEIEEIIYQATAYAGFPAASQARAVAENALREAGVIA